jgi:hypothetical protein
VFIGSYTIGDSGLFSCSLEGLVDSDFSKFSFFLLSSSNLSFSSASFFNCSLLFLPLLAATTFLVFSISFFGDVLELANFLALPLFTVKSSFLISSATSATFQIILF